MAKRKAKFIHKPVYPGGNTAMQKFIKANLKYPPEALKNKIEGSVKVDYSINQAGKVVKAKAVDGPKNGCRKEAERLVKLLRFSVPKDYKMTVQYHQHLTINFKLPQQKLNPKKVQTQTKITYSIKSGEGEGSEKKEGGDSGKGGGYAYTIKW